MWANILAIVFAVLAVLGIFVSYYFYIRSKVFAATEDAINNAEQEDKVAEEKMELAVNQIYGIVPAFLKPFLTKKMIERFVQMAFDRIEEYAKKQKNKKAFALVPFLAVGALLLFLI